MYSFDRAKAELFALTGALRRNYISKSEILSVLLLGYDPRLVNNGN